MTDNDNTETTTIANTEEQNVTNVPIPATEYTILVERLTGTVKWFNNRAGFGFITVCEPGEYENKEIFVHWSSIRVSNSQYKYLFQGEYVDFTLVKANNNNHEYQAMNVSGVKGGPIMCETRRSLNMGSGGRSPGGPAPPARYQGGPRQYNDEYRPPRRVERGAGAGAGAGDRSRPRTARPPPGDVPAADSNLLEYVKVQSKRNRRNVAKPPTAAAAATTTH